MPVKRFFNGLLEGQLVGTTRLPSIQPGAAYEIALISSAGFGGTRGEYVQVFAVADAAGEVRELNETNNTAVQSIRLPMTVPGDLGGDEDVDWDDFTILAGLPCRPRRDDTAARM